MKKYILAFIAFILFSGYGFGQEKFTKIINIEKTSIKNQQRTGTCWSFATASFLESEVLRIKGMSIDLSEMYNVRNIYEDKARNYFLRQGKANFSQGGLSHDFINGLANYGLVPQEVYTGKPKGEVVYNHTELFNVLNGYIGAAVKSKKHTDYWFDGFKAILNTYLGKKPVDFLYKGKKYTPKTFAKSLGIEPKNYIEFTSFSHHPFNKYFVLEIPDNYSSGLYYNIKTNELKSQTDYALEHGFSVSWDGDVSEPGFGRTTGIIDVDIDYLSMSEKDLEGIRQGEFYSIKTTDDHLMHIVGKVKDENNKKYYIIKNSWGNSGPFNGYYYMSEDYFLLKTVAIMIHRDAVMKEIKPKFFIQDVIY